MNRISWDELHFTSAILWAQRSLDPSSQVGCTIVSQDNVPISYGYNNPPRGIELSEAEWHNKEHKYMWVEHGERNAIFNAIRSGASVVGSKLYIIATPCTDCARAIIQSGIRDVFVLNSTNDIWLKNPAWIEKLKQTVAMFKASGVNCMLLNTEIKGEFNIRIAGKLYTISGTNINELNNCA